MQKIEIHEKADVAVGFLFDKNFKKNGVQTSNKFFALTERIPEVRQKWANPINTITIGATPEEGGTRTRTVTVGGSTTLPFLHFEGKIPHRPALAMEVQDITPKDWPALLGEHFSDVWDDPGRWAKKCVDQFGADLVCLRLAGCDPDGENKSPDEAAVAVKSVLEAVGVPLIVWGCGDNDKNNEVLPR